VKPVIVAIDGPAGAGKSTIARRLADLLGYVMLDTGALYRSIAVAAKRQGVSWEKQEQVTAIAKAIAAADALQLRADAKAPRGLRVLLHGEDVSTAIREHDISMGASLVSAIPGVRQALLALQQGLGRSGGVVAEGRDIGTVVFPQAEVKFFLTASVDVRTRRRVQELAASGKEVAFDTVRADVMQRDKQDSERPIAPLKQAEDALLVDSSERSIDQVVEEMRRAVDRARG
jgi:CMP/dCMP kinase